jgi:hypothetical protein
MPMDGWRLGLGAGYAFYMGDKMGTKITTNYGDFNELKTNFTFAGFKQLDESREWGLVLKMGRFQTLNNNLSFGNQCNFQELQSIWQKSLNDNIALNGNRVTVNFQYGFGFAYFKSQYFVIDPNFQTAKPVVSSVGYGFDNRTDWKGDAYTDIPNKKITFLTNLGFNLGFRVARNLSLYFENSVQITASNKFSGNLNKESKIPPDMYYYTGISLFYRFGLAGGRLSCPKF